MILPVKVIGRFTVGDPAAPGVIVVVVMIGIESSTGKLPKSLFSAKPTTAAVTVLLEEFPVDVVVKAFPPP